MCKGPAVKKASRAGRHRYSEWPEPGLHSGGVERGEHRHTVPSLEEPRKDRLGPPRGSRGSLRHLKQGREAVRCVSRKSRLTYRVQTGPTGRRGCERQGGGAARRLCRQHSGSDCCPGRRAGEEPTLATNIQ